MSNSRLIVVIGSGPAGANAALTLLKNDHQVLLLDLGQQELPLPSEKFSFDDLKEFLPDPQSYFLGENLSGIISPRTKSLFSLPPSRNYLAASKEFESTDFLPFLSHAKGGFGVAWAANAIPWDENDLRAFPLDKSDFLSASKETQKRMRISGGLADSLSSDLEYEDALLPPLAFNRHDQHLYSSFQKISGKLQNYHHLSLGHSRVAVDTNPESDQSCVYCNRCFWGCPRQAIYSPLRTLHECQMFTSFEYRANCRVTRLHANEGKINALSYLDTKTNQEQKITVEAVVLGAGALSSASIFLNTLHGDPSMTDYFRNHPLKTVSVLDTLSTRIPYVFLPMLGMNLGTRDYQFNKLLLRYEQTLFPDMPKFVQGQVLSLSSLLYHPLINSLPFGTHFGSRIFFHLRSALGAITYFLPDQPYRGNGISLKRDREPGASQLEIFYENDPRKLQLLEAITSDTQKAFKKLWAFCPSKQREVRPNGFGIHYAGTIPMARESHPLKSNPDGRSHLYKNLYVADGSAFPELPSKSITFNTVAHAIRVADKIS